MLLKIPLGLGFFRNELVFWVGWPFKHIVTILTLNSSSKAARDVCAWQGRAFWSRMIKNRRMLFLLSPTHRRNGCSPGSRVAMKVSILAPSWNPETWENWNHVLWRGGVVQVCSIISNLHYGGWALQRGGFLGGWTLESGRGLQWELRQL